MKSRTVSIAADFSRFPAGRFRSDGPHSGEEFRERILVPLLTAGDRISVNLDGTLGYGSSFLEEAFGGLVRGHAMTAAQLRAQLEFISADATLTREIWQYIDDADGRARGRE